MAKLHRIASVLVLSTLATGLTSVTAVAGPSDVPFSATLTTMEDIRPNPQSCNAFPYLQGTTTGSGHAKHLGAVTGRATDCITPSMSTSTFSNGNLSLIAANGDELLATYKGSLSPTMVNPISKVDGTYEIIGGTGRFNAATGVGKLSGVLNTETGQGQLTFKGTISY